MDESKIELTDRLRRERRWEEAAQFRETARADFRSNGMGRQEAVDAAWEAMAEAYPPLPDSDLPDIDSGGRVSGLGTIPADWPELPDSASLTSELRWAHANRLLVIKEQSNFQTVVDLSRALRPAPSWAALSWLETGIFNLAKFADIVAKHLKDDPEELRSKRPQRMAVEEIRSLLAEMHED